MPFYLIPDIQMIWYGTITTKVQGSTHAGMAEQTNAAASEHLRSIVLGLCVQIRIKLQSWRAIITNGRTLMQSQR
jgi:hypothetical protein